MSKKLYQVLTSTTGNDLADNDQKDFAMEDIRAILELESKTAAINEWIEMFGEPYPQRTSSTSSGSWRCFCLGFDLSVCNFSIGTGHQTLSKKKYRLLNIGLSMHTLTATSQSFMWSKTNGHCRRWYQIRSENESNARAEDAGSKRVSNRLLVRNSCMGTVLVPRRRQQQLWHSGSP